MEQYVDYIGYFGSVFVLLSFITKKMTRLRVLNLVGCSCFIVYGMLTPVISWPIVLTNGAIVIVNAVYLMMKK